MAALGPQRLSTEAVWKRLAVFTLPRPKAEGYPKYQTLVVSAVIKSGTCEMRIAGPLFQCEAAVVAASTRQSMKGMGDGVRPPRRGYAQAK
jgi:hypothetical protein